MPELERLFGLRIVAKPEAIEATEWPDDAIALRIAPDDTFVLGTEAIDVPDEHAIVEAETGFAGVWLDATEAKRVLEAECEWPIPTERPSFAQGMVAHLPVKLWLEEKRVLFVVPAPFAADLEERLT